MAEQLSITIIRRGGFAAFDDRIVIEPDGALQVRSRARPQGERGRLVPDWHHRLTAACAAVDWPALGTAQPQVRYPDDMIVAVSTPEGIARTEDDRLGELGPLADGLINDLMGGIADSTAATTEG